MNLKIRLWRFDQRTGVFLMLRSKDLKGENLTTCAKGAITARYSGLAQCALLIAAWEGRGRSLMGCPLEPPLKHLELSCGEQRDWLQDLTPAYISTVPGTQ